MLQDLEYIKTDFLVVGTGIAGLYTALNLSSLGQVIILTKEQIEDSNTQYAQGGIAAVLDQGDSWELHLEDTLQAGAGLCDYRAVQVLVQNGPDRVRELIKLGTNFDHIEGTLDLTREGAHSKRRILHARGDATGVEIREALTRVIQRNNNVIVREDSFMIDLVLAGDPLTRKVAGVVVFDQRRHCYQIYLARVVVLASGGCGQIYANTSNPDVTTGDGIAAAYRAGATLIDMEFMQFHPTTLYNPTGPSFLISESVRGEGGILLNKKKERFMPNYHPQAELAPRDIVARSILKEAEKDGMPYVWLDVTACKPGFVEKRFPTIYQTLLKYGHDLSQELIPVIPAAHYMMGGVRTDIDGQTDVERLYACGEVACNGVHGANRLASNSLLDGLVFGHRIYEAIRARRSTLNMLDNYNALLIPPLKPNGQASPLIKEIGNRLRQEMDKKVGMIRKSEQLETMIRWSQQQWQDLNNYPLSDQESWELANMLQISGMIARAALLREESRGGHYRSDFPVKEAHWSKTHIIFNLDYPEGKQDVLE